MLTLFAMRERATHCLAVPFHKHTARARIEAEHRTMVNALRAARATRLTRWRNVEHPLDPAAPLTVRIQDRKSKGSQDDAHLGL